MTGAERTLALAAIDEGFAEAVKHKFGILAGSMTADANGALQNFADGLDILVAAHSVARKAILADTTT